ncbi:MAG: hypothetical protein ACR2LJ_11440 [Acidimicrobiales bacterium]
MTATAFPPRPPAVLVLVADLRWAGAPGVLDGWAKASLSVRTDRQRGDAADGYLTVGKGERAATPAPAKGVGQVEPTGDGGVRLVDWDRLRAYDDGTNYAGTLGALGQTLTGAGRRWALVTSGPRTSAAAAAVADRDGVVARASDGGAPAVGLALSAGAEAVVVAVPAAEVASVVDAAGSACVVVASVSSPDADRHLGVLATSAECGLGRAGLSSPSTHQAHLATIDDVAPTFLSRLGVPQRRDMSGSVVRPSGPVSVTDLVERDRRSSTADRMRTPLVWLFIALSAVGALVAVSWPRARPAVAWVLLAVPPAGFLVMAVPWWRWGGAGALVVGAAVAAALAAGAAVVGRRRVRLGVGALAAVTVAVVGIDAAFGGRLEIDAPFGNSPVTGGRFYGVGNIGSGFLMAGLIVAAGLALDHWGRRAVAPCVAALGAGVVVGGAPWFGADVGGALASVPAYGILIGARRRPSLRAAVTLAVVTAAVVGLFVAADLARPLSARSHLGRVISDGTLIDEIVRKGNRALETVTSPLSLVVAIGVGAVVAVRPRLGARPALAAMTWALVVAGVIGSVVNDSGLLVGAAVTAVAWPALVAVAGTDLGPSGPLSGVLGPSGPLSGVSGPRPADGRAGRDTDLPVTTP